LLGQQFQHALKALMLEMPVCSRRELLVPACNRPVVPARLRQTANVQRQVTMAFVRTDWSRSDNQGCQMIEAEVQLPAGAKAAG
jgi:hypothetical protein